MTDLMPLALLGGVLALDTTSVGQFMISRPIVAATLAGAILGDMSLGLSVGIVLELYLLVAFPTGGSRFPEGSTASIVAVAAASAVAPAESLPVGVAMGLTWGYVGGHTITVLRKINGRFVPEPESRVVSRRRLVMVHLGTIALDFVRASLLTLVGIVVGRRIVGAVAADWPLTQDDSVAFVLVGAAVSGGVLLRVLGGFRRRRLLFAAGLAAGILGARFLT